MFKYKSLSKFRNYSLSEVEVKWTPPEGLFKNGSSLNIAREVWNSHDKDLKRSLACINYYINRAGDNLSSDRLEVLEKAKERIRNWDELNSHNFSALEVVSMDPGNDSKYSEIIGVNEIVPGVDDTKKSYGDLIKSYKEDLIEDINNKKVESELHKAELELSEPKEDSNNEESEGESTEDTESKDENESSEDSSEDTESDEELIEDTESEDETDSSEESTEGDESIDSEESSEETVDETSESDESVESSESNEETKELNEMEEKLVSNMIDLTDRITKLTEAVLGKSSEDPVESKEELDAESAESVELTDGENTEVAEDTKESEEVESDTDEESSEEDIEESEDEEVESDTDEDTEDSKESEDEVESDTEESEDSKLANFSVRIKNLKLGL